MKINFLVDKNYRLIDIQEEVFEVSEWLKETKYLVPVNENLEAVGIVTIHDIHNHPYGKIKDCDFEKPKINIDQTLLEVLHIMQETDQYYLPVFESGKFIGVISLIKIASAMEYQLNILSKNITEL